MVFLEQAKYCSTRKNVWTVKSGNGSSICLLHNEQKNLSESLSDEYKSEVVCSEDNPNFIAGRRGHGGVAIFWKQTLDNFVSPLDIVSDRIVGIQINAPNQDLLFILSVYFPSSNHQFTEFCECLDLLWSCDIYDLDLLIIFLSFFLIFVRTRLGHITSAKV